MNIAASSELVSRLSSHRQVVSLDSTDFTDVAAVVITVADSRSGILALLKRTGFHIPVFLFARRHPCGLGAAGGRPFRHVSRHMPARARRASATGRATLGEW